MARTLQSHAEPTAKPPPHVAPTETGLMQQRRILIVEDKEQEQQLLKQLLEDPALIVDTVGEGVEALERLNSRSYSIVITDLKMPRLSGMQLIEEVQKRRLPVTVIVTPVEGADMAAGQQADLVDTTGHRSGHPPHHLVTL